MPNWTHIMIHHSLTADSGTVSWPAIRKYHVETMGMHDVGYHWGLELCGSSYEALVGRSLYDEGAHANEQGMNHKAIGICMVGNFDLQAPPDAALVVLRDRLMVPLMREFSILPANIVFHRDVAPWKTCPGKMFTKALLAQYVPGIIV
jgi:hypothetical protein